MIQRIVLGDLMLRIVLLIFSLVMGASAQWTDLFESGAPGAKRPPQGSEKSGEGGRLSDIDVPQYQVYLPDRSKATGAAVIILPGGGYTILAADHEGHDYAKWLAERGIAGIVVKYRVSGSDAFGYSFPVPFLDARRAIRVTRAKSVEWGVDRTRIGIMGSSAGGHLASLCATRFADVFSDEGGDAIDKESCRPDFAILIYPVISMDAELAHGGSRRRLLGADPSPEMIANYSTERAVGPETPPVFLLSTADDFVDCRNSLAFAAACKTHKVPVTLHLFEKGGHGYGLKGKGELENWPLLLENWLRTKYPGP